MCGRVDLHDLDAPCEAIRRFHEGRVAERCEGVRTGYNLPPSLTLPVWRKEGEGGIVEGMRWGLVPHWARDEALGKKLINARAETLGEKPSFRDAYHRRRCIVPINGFYEWRKIPGSSRKEPWYFTGRAEPFLFLGGLWEEWKRGDEEPLHSFTIVTTEPNGLVSPVHDRMPLILRDPEELALWLDPEVHEEEALRPLLRPAPEEWMRGWRVQDCVSDPHCDGPEAIRSAGLF